MTIDLGHLFVAALKKVQNDAFLQHFMACMKGKHCPPVGNHTCKGDANTCEK